MRRVGFGELPVATASLAQALIGYILVRETDGEITAGRIIECEAYALNDPASHAYGGPRPRTASMFLHPFHAYVYQIYGMYFCFNVSSETEGEGAGVLVRALEPLEGIPRMQQRRGTDRVADLCRGPGRVCAALDIDRSLDGVDLLRDPRLWIAAGDRPAGAIGVSRRIGISRAAALELRFYERGNPLLSGPKSLSPD
ncbi:MAG: DNA-3-methyladenine glycosylase [Candidatus Eremiobacteraeota bacterium]|nr:DNA-3-methyladenine glycosylase [Candidatus Eremiobacteraeota bacterium]